ncbi:MAG: RNA polymerase sigma-70 factor [Cyclobacteriaceae bacterium]|nr:RNA polymerase sigma-70 factor [Cyclobacteriaceae bacterium]
MAGEKTYDEAILLKDLSNGDELAFKKIYNIYSRRLYAKIFSIVRKEEISKELLQDVFLKLWEKRTSIDTSKSFSSFLYTITTNLVIDYLRKDIQEKKMMYEVKASGMPSGNTTEEMIHFSEFNTLIQRAIDSLPPQRRMVFTLCKEEGFSYEKIGLTLGITKSTVSDHMVKAIKTIKRFIAISIR